MTDQSNRTFVCSVLFLDIVEYSKKSVSEQLRLKQRFNTMLVRALEHVAQADRIVLDTGDGAAISFLGNPEESLFVATDLRDFIKSEAATGNAALQVRMGINLGPVRLIKDINGQLNIIGDGINVAQRVMSFCEPGIILVSRSYYEVVSRLSDDYLQLFEDVGTRTDKHVREHSVYAVSVSPSTSYWKNIRRDHGELGLISSEAELADKRFSKSSIRLPYLVGAPLVALLVIGSAVSWRHVRTSQDLDQMPQVKQESPVQSEKLRSGTAQITNETLKSLRQGKLTENVEPVRSQAEDSRVHSQIKGGIVELLISPWGEVYVDGRLRGVSPPVKRLLLKEGRHRIVIRNAAFPPYTETIEVRAGKKEMIRHRFQ